MSKPKQGEGADQSLEDLADRVNSRGNKGKPKPAATPQKPKPATTTSKKK